MASLRLEKSKQRGQVVTNFIQNTNNVMPNQSPDQLRNDEIEGRYSNYFLVGHNAFEFVIDFGQMYTGMQECIHTRIITTPTYAKELLKTLREALDEYERQFGGA